MCQIRIAFPLVDCHGKDERSGLKVPDGLAKAGHYGDRCSVRLQADLHYGVNGGGFSTSLGITRMNWPRCSSSRPLPPRPVTSYLVVLIVCSPPRLVSTRSRSRSPVEATNPRTRSSADCSLTRITPLPGPDRKLISSTAHSIACASC